MTDKTKQDAARGQPVSGERNPQDATKSTEDRNKDQVDTSADDAVDGDLEDEADDSEEQ